MNPSNNLNSLIELANHCKDYGISLEIDPQWILDVAEQMKQSTGTLPKTCDGKEQDAFEEYGKENGLDMTTHPIFWMFTHPETNAARSAWRGCLDYVNKVVKGE